LRKLTKSENDFVLKALGAASVVLDSPKARRLRKEALAKSAPAVNNPVASDAYYTSLMAQSEAEDNMARERERQADEAHQTMLASSDRDIVNHYSGKESEHRAHAELHRERARSHRAAAAAYRAR
jgi:hypothetical protein